MKYKVGDRVRIKSLDWYNEAKKSLRVGVILKPYHFSQEMKGFCGRVLTIKSVRHDHYEMEDCYSYRWTDEMIEGLAEESDDFEKMYMESEKRYEEEYSKGEYCHEQSFKWGFQEGYDYAHENEKLEINLKNGYEFRDEKGNVINAMKIVLEKKKNEYPKTYEECAEIIAELTGSDCNPKGCMGYMSVQLTALQKLLICRDAYWKIAGEEMGLGKPWKPQEGVIYCYMPGAPSYIRNIFPFPTKEMRDAFYENFKKEIEICKELL